MCRHGLYNYGTCTYLQVLSRTKPLLKYTMKHSAIYISGFYVRSKKGKTQITWPRLRPLSTYLTENRIGRASGLVHIHRFHYIDTPIKAPTFISLSFRLCCVGTDTLLQSIRLADKNREENLRKIIFQYVFLSE